MYPLKNLVAGAYGVEDLGEISDLGSLQEYLTMAATEASPQFTPGSAEFVPDPLTKYYVVTLDAGDTGDPHRIPFGEDPAVEAGAGFTVFGWVWVDSSSQPSASADTFNTLIYKINRGVTPHKQCWSIGVRDTKLCGTGSEEACPGSNENVTTEITASASNWNPSKLHVSDYVLVSTAVRVVNGVTHVGYYYGWEGQTSTYYTWVTPSAETNGLRDCDGNVTVGGDDGHLAHVRWYPRVFTEEELQYVVKNGQTAEEFLGARSSLTKENGDSYRDSGDNNKPLVEVEPMGARVIQLAPPLLLQFRWKESPCSTQVHVKDLVSNYLAGYVYSQSMAFCDSNVGMYFCDYPYSEALPSASAQALLPKALTGDLTLPRNLPAADTELRNNFACGDLTQIEKSAPFFGKPPIKWAGEENAYVEFLDLHSHEHLMRSGSIEETPKFVDHLTKELQLLALFYAPQNRAITKLKIVFFQFEKTSIFYGKHYYYSLVQLSEKGNLEFLIMMVFLLFLIAFEMYRVAYFRPSLVDKDRDRWLKLIETDSEIGSDMLKNSQTADIIEEGRYWIRYAQKLSEGGNY